MQTTDGTGRGATAGEAQGTRPAWEGLEVRPFQLVLEGGAMRSLFTAGVLDFMLDHGLLAQSVIGTSAGAMCGYNYAAGAPGRMAYVIMRYRHDWRFTSLRSKLRTGNLVGSDFIYRTIPRLENVDQGWFLRSPVECTCVCTDLDTGDAVYHTFQKSGDTELGARWCMATSALPFANRPVEVDGHRLMDGGVADSIPYAHDASRFGGRQVVILTRSRDFVHTTHDWTMPAARVWYRRHPQFARRVRLRDFEYNDQHREVERMHEAGECFAIWPDAGLRLSLVEASEKQLLAVYEHGLATAARVWPALLDFLGI